MISLLHFSEKRKELLEKLKIWVKFR